MAEKNIAKNSIEIWSMKYKIQYFHVYEMNTTDSEKLKLLN